MSNISVILFPAEFLRVFCLLNGKEKYKCVKELSPGKQQKGEINKNIIR